jgi:DNA-binding LacI/PurR family transcriptional regulator
VSSRATVKDVATLAGVSPKTVSNVVSGTVPVAPATRERVQAAIAQLGYRPNASARQLRGGRSGFIGLLVPQLDAPYFGELVRHHIEAATEAGFTVLVDQTDGRRERELRLVEGDHPLHLDGLIAATIALTLDDLAARRDPTPLVLLGEQLVDAPYDRVSIDDVASARAATDHLLALRRRRIAVLGAGSRDHVKWVGLRARGFHEALAAAGLPPADPRLLVAVDDFRRPDGAAAMRALLELDERPDAVLAINDELALGALRVILEAGLRVPQDIALAGFDDIADGRFSTPSLTTVAPDKRATARTAVSALVARIAGTAPQEPQRFDLPFELVVRESTVGG